MTSRAGNEGRASAGGARRQRASRLVSDRRGGAFVEYIFLLGLVAIIGMLAWPQFGSASNAKVELQAECGLLNADCGGPPSGAATGKPPAAVTSGLQGKLDALAAAAKLPDGATPPDGGGFWDTVGGAFSTAWDVTKSVGTGFFVDGLWGTVTGVWHIVTHPIDTVKGLWTAVTNPVQTYNAIKDALANAWNEDPARFIGAGIFEVVTLPIAALKASKVGKVGKTGKLTDEMGDAVRVSSETTGAVTNLGKRTVAQNAELFAKLEPGSGMTGVFDHKTGTVILRPSLDLPSGTPLPEGTVARYGGHASVREDLGAALGEDLGSAAPGRLSGFSITKNPDGTIGFGWNSGQINPGSHGGGNGVPAALRPEIETAVRGSLGL
jgi:hypothetical protein